jgi:hypothetical protein
MAVAPCCAALQAAGGRAASVAADVTADDAPQKVRCICDGSHPGGNPGLKPSPGVLLLYSVMPSL